MPPSPLFFVAVTALVLVLLPHTTAQPEWKLTSGLKRDRRALRALANSISDFGRSKAGAWKARGNPCFPKAWPHVQCAFRRVVGIELSNLEIVGTLPGQLRLLNKLERINLENNQFVGNIPERWANRRSFRKLEEINLANNLLSGELPNRMWNARGGFRSLRSLNLASNNFVGGLPDGWLSTANTFRSLRELDLSDNQLGKDKDGNDFGANAWCLNGRTDDSGWCPTTVVKSRAARLENLDLSENGLVGSLPTQWPQLFPELQALLLHRNNLYASADAPSALPQGWTRRTVPKAFPQLETLVLYPGNDNICSLPATDGSFDDINKDFTYVVESFDSEMDFDGENPWFCPGPSISNPPTDVGLLTNGTNLEVVWNAPTGANMANMVYGYVINVCKEDVDTLECEPTGKATAKTVRVYGSLDVGVSFNALVHAKYKYDTGLPKGPNYKVSVATFNMDGVESEAAIPFLSVDR